MNLKHVLIGGIVLLSVTTSYASTLIVRDNDKCTDVGGHIFKAYDIMASINGAPPKQYLLADGVAQGTPATINEISVKWMDVMVYGAGFGPPARNILMIGKGPSKTVVVSVTGCKLDQNHGIYFDGTVDYQNN